MLFADFKRIVTAFADSTADVDLARGVLLTQIRDEVIEAQLTTRAGDVFVEEGGTTYPASTWLINRVARIPLLADRLLSYVPGPEHFVTPSGTLLDQPNESPNAADAKVPDAVLSASKLLDRRASGTTSVVYLTSDAGEGKTTLISVLARQQAAAYKAKTAEWLLVPIPLGGRTFLRFDDVVVAALVNRLRFPFLYFDAFLELVRLGVIVPAFDGFEEMIIEASTGEAISALGNLVRNLRSEGTILIAARKAYFDYPSFRAQAKLFDAIGQDSVAFARLAIDRWGKSHFVEYAAKRRLKDPEALYAAVARRLSPSHPLLTRAVLVRRLVDVAKETPDLSTLLEQIGYHPQDYFFQFANAIVEREARDKWLDQSGDPPQPLLSVDEHHALLALVAQEMWLSSTDGLRSDLIGVVGDVFAETHKKSPAMARQIRERLKQHSLLVAGETHGTVAFDHEDFRVFYLGEALGHALGRSDAGDIKQLLQVSSLPRASIDEAILFLRRHNLSPIAALDTLQRVAKADLPTSFVRENAGAIAIGLLTDTGTGDATLIGLSFPPEALNGRHLVRTTFEDCYFQPTSLINAILEGCSFTRCRFERLEVPDDARIAATVRSCEVGSLIRLDNDEQLFDPDAINTTLQEYGFSFVDTAQVPLAFEPPPQDEELWLLERVLRIFMRSTHVNESVIRTRLGVKFSIFMTDAIPKLLRAQVFEEVQFTGSGSQRRFKLAVPMAAIQAALTACKGNFDAFLRRFDA